MSLGGGSLHRRLRLTLGGLAVTGLVAIAVLFQISAAVHARSVEATARFVEDERTSDRITRAVIRQLAVAAAFPTVASAAEREDFLARGAVIHDELRRYLFGDLTPEERVRLAEVREAHQRFEVQAAQAAELFARGADVEAEAALATMAELVDQFLEGLEGFFAIRLEALDRLQRTQESLLDKLLWGALVLGAGLVGFALAAAWELNRRVARPLAALSRMTERVAAGELGARLPSGGDDEFRELAGRFNRMAEALQRRNEELTRALDEVKEAQAELVASEKLSAIGRMSAGFAHELNNPLTSVLGYAELLSARIASDPPPDRGETEELVAPILSEASRARELIRSLLQVARRPEGSTGAVSVRKSLEVVVGLRSYAFRHAGLEISVSGVPDVWVKADPHLLHGVFLNLVNNAYDAMRDDGGGALAISGVVRETDDVVDLHFSDTGPGLDQPDRIFEPFFTTKPVGEGTGLGLSLVHQFVTSFGGSIRGSTDEGGGARFVVCLPLASGPEPSSEPGSTATPARADTDEEPPTGQPEESGRESTVLVVEDEPHLLRLQRRILERAGIGFVGASTVSEARHALRTETIDLIVSDVKMPGESGITLFDEVRASHPEMGERFLFVTGDTTVPGLDRIIREHGDIVIRKPFRTEEYLSRVWAILAR